MQHPFEPYRFADLSGSEECVKQIRELEQQLSQQQGVSVTLIAFEPESSQQEK